MGVSIHTAFLIKRLFSKPFKYIMVTDTCSSNPPTLFLTFSRYGFFNLDHRYNYEYYTWSKLYCMNTCSIKHTTELGDEFYLILRSDKTNRILRRSNIICIYNKKMFKLGEE